MKMDASKFKKLHSDEKKTVFQHPRGHKIEIVHAALSPKMRKDLSEIKGYADGGGVEKPWYEKAWNTFNDALSSQEEISRDKAKEMTKAGELEKTAGAYVPVQMGALAPRPEQGPAPASLDPQPAQQALVAAQPAQAQAPGMPNLMGDMRQMKGAVNENVAAAQEQGNMEAQFAREQQNAMIALQQHHQQQSQKLMAEYQNVLNDVKQQHINPNHYMESMSGGKRAATIVGMLLSGIGSGLAHQDNMAAKMLQQQIDRDIDAQKANLGKSETLLSANLKQMGNLNDATQLTQAMQMGIYAAKIREASAKVMGPEAKMRGMEMAMKLDIQASEILQKQAQAQSVKAALGDPRISPLAKIQALPKEMQNEALKELHAYTKVKSQLGEVGHIMKEIYDNSTLGAKLSDPIQSSKRAEKAEAKLFPVVKAIVGERMSDNDTKSLIHPYVSGFFTSKKTMQENLADLESQLIAAAVGETPILSQYGIVPKLTGSPKTKTVNGVTYMRGPNGEAIRVK